PPALTRARPPSVARGRRMAQLLLEEIAGRTGERPTVVLPTELVVRDSS
ncbi:substrate-binding domain-containing protein, partial [Streptomyces microflavus]